MMGEVKSDDLRNLNFLNLVKNQLKESRYSSLSLLIFLFTIIVQILIKFFVMKMLLWVVRLLLWSSYITKKQCGSSGSTINSRRFR